jgi:hypothetical protein
MGRKCGSIQALLHTPSWRSAELVKHTDKFIFYRLILFMETVVVCYENREKFTNEFCGYKAEFCYDGGGTYSSQIISHSYQIMCIAKEL